MDELQIHVSHTREITEMESIECSTLQNVKNAIQTTDHLYVIYPPSSRTYSFSYKFEVKNNVWHIAVLKRDGDTASTTNITRDCVIYRM